MNATAAHESVPRRLGVGDGLILIVALAICLERFLAIHWFEFFPRSLKACWGTIAYFVGLGPWSSALGQNRTEVISRLPIEIIRLWLYTLCPVLLGLMVAQPMIRLRRPRPPTVEVLRQSGFVTCLIGLALVAMLLTIGELWFSGLALTLPLTRVFILLMLWPMLGLAPWRTERSWVDRLGRAVGWGWILAISGAAVLEYSGWI